MPKQFLTVEDIEQKSQALGQMILETGYKPDLVVGIKFGGHLVGMRVAKILKVPYQSMSVKRGLSAKIARMPEKFRPFKKLYGIFEDLYYKFSTPYVDTPLTQRIGTEHKVLLLDDDIVLRKTIDVALRHLIEMGANTQNIKIGSMIVHPRANPQPDFFVEVGDAVFPWNIYSPHYEDFKKSKYTGLT